MTPHDRRLQLLNGGYSPTPVKGKAPVLSNWQTRPLTNPDEIRLWATTYPAASNTGITTRLTPALDVDILNPEAADAVEQLVRDRFGEDGARVLVRFGKPPKRAIVFRTARPFAKITAMLLASNEPDSKRPEQRVEFLGDGQQIVVDGIHPETRQPYRWHGGCVGDIKHDELPEIGEAQAKALVEDIVDLLVKEHGYRLVDAKGNPITDGAKGHDPDGVAEPLEWPAFGDLIDHDQLTSFAMKLLKAGMHPAAAKNMLRHFIAEVPSIDPSRRDRRLSEIGGIVNSAEWELRRIAAQKQAKAVGVESLDEWDAGDDPGTIRPREWLLGNQFCRGFVSSLFAAGGTGKTSLRLLQLLSMALGRSLCGQHVFQRCRVLLLTLEDNDAEIQRRVEAVLLHYGIDRSELKGWLFCKAVRRQKLAVMVGHERQVGPLEKTLREAIERRNADVVCLDPFVKTHGLAESDNMDMDFVADLMVTLAIEYNIAVDSPHHVHKGSITPGDADSGRGASGIRDAARLTYTLCVMSEDEAKGFSILPDERFSYVRVDSAKVNIAVNKRAEWFHLVGKRLGNVTDTYPNGDTVQVAEPWQPPETWAGLSNQVLNAILDEIASGPRDENGEMTGEFYSNAPAAKERAAWPVVQRLAPHKNEKQCREIIRTWIKNGLLIERDYKSPSRDSREVSGLFVENSKRLGSWH